MSTVTQRPPVESNVVVLRSSMVLSAVDSAGGSIGEECDRSYRPLRDSRISIPRHSTGSGVDYEKGLRKNSQIGFQCVVERRVCVAQYFCGYPR